MLMSTLLYTEQPHTTKNCLVQNVTHANHKHDMSAREPCSMSFLGGGILMVVPREQTLELTPIPNGVNPQSQENQIG